MGKSPCIFSLLMCMVLQSALGRETDAFRNVGVIGGHKINIEDAPFMAGFLRHRLVQCAGSIIHEQFILTSATCARTWYPIQHAHVGSNRARKGGFYPAVIDMFCHEQFNKQTYENNICLLKLREPLSFNTSAIAKVDLPGEDISLATGTLVNVTGWGNTDSTGDQYPKYLQQTTMTVVPDWFCLDVANNMSEEMLCAGLDGHDSCTGDGGGPLTLNNVQIGIVSFGAERCGERTGVHTKVSKYINWIRNTIRQNL